MSRDPLLLAGPPGFGCCTPVMSFFRDLLLRFNALSAALGARLAARLAPATARLKGIFARVRAAFAALYGRLPEAVRGPLTVAAILLSGIRAKLAWFTGFLILVTVAFLSGIYLRQQAQILTESYEREAAISRRYISALVLELDNISQSLIRIEEFRNRVAEQREALKKYRTTRVVQEEKQISLFGMRTSLFGALGERSVRRISESYYSAYLSNTDIDVLEESTRAQLQGAGGERLSDPQFARLQQLARRFADADGKVAEQRRSIEELRDQGAGALDAADSPRARKIAELEKGLRTAQEAARLRRLELDAQIANLLAASRKRKIQELGLDTGRFRIQTFPIGAVAPGQTPQPTLDTSLFDPDRALNQPLNAPGLNEALISALDALSASLSRENDITPTDFEQGAMQLQALYSAYFRNPNSTRRARLLDARRDAPGRLEPYLRADATFSAELAALQPAIAKRVGELRARRPPTPPFRDAEFRKLYADYTAIVEKRSAAFRELGGADTPAPDAPTAGGDADGETPIDAELDAIATLRESALEDGTLLRFREASGEHAEYLRSAERRARSAERWAALRAWIAAGESETPPPELARLFPDGIIGNSRTEAEQLLWKLDGAPLIAPDREDAVAATLDRNFAGVIRTIVDRTAGLEAIRSNRNRAVLSALGIAALSILFAVFISGFVVQKIRRIIRSAEDVGRGNLNVEFESGGRDEFGNLTIALNHMVVGLRDREKIKGVLGSMVDPVVVTEALKDLAALKRGSEKRITAFFSDVAGFSSISEKLSSSELAALLNEYLSAMTLILKANGGVLDKYIGDAIVGIWNAPVEVDQHCLRAVRASLQMMDRMQELRELWTREKKYIPEAREMSFRIGLNTGLAKVGFMGTDALASYTMMGDTVNLAARLEAAAKDYGVHILASDAVYREVEGETLARRLDLVRVKGKSEPVELYEILSLKANAPAKLQEACAVYEDGLRLYLERNWSAALQKFARATELRGGADKAAALLTERCQHYAAHPPEPRWDGVFTRDHK